MSNDPDVKTDSSDPSPYIRTYAKDVAALTGQKPVSAAAAIPSKEEPPTLPNHDRDSLLVSSAPSAQPADLSQLEKEAERIESKKETAQEAEDRIQDIRNAASSGLLQSISLPDIQPGDIVPGVTSAPVADADREAVLERLRAKASGLRPASTPLMPSSFSPTPAYEPPPVQTPVEPAPPPLPKAEVRPEPKVSPFHSFSSDFADRIDKQHASTFSVLAAEKDAAPKTAAPRKKSNLLPIIAGIVLVIIGAGGIFAAYRFMTATAPIPAISAGSYLIIPDEKIALTGEGTTLLAALANQATQPLPANSVLLTYINAATTTKQGVIEAPATGGAFLTALNLPAPDILLRNIDPSSMVGVVNDGAQTRAFFILRVLSYERTFAGMLDWESSIGNDLSVLYPAYPASTATSTATTTTETTASSAQFVDEVVANHDARALKDTEGRTIIIYGYADKQTLIIARDEAAFTLLLSRLTANNQ
jgi:hypothetical protein